MWPVNVLHLEKGYDTDNDRNNSNTVIYAASLMRRVIIYFYL